MTKYKRIGPVYKAIKFTGKNGKEVSEFLRQNFVRTRSGNGWIKIMTPDGEMVSFTQGWWFLRDIVTGTVEFHPDTLIRIDFKYFGRQRPVRWVRKGADVEAIQLDGNAKDVAHFARIHGAYAVRAGASWVNYDGDKPVRLGDWLIWHEDKLNFEVMDDDQFALTYKAR